MSTSRRLFLRRVIIDRDGIYLLSMCYELNEDLEKKIEYGIIQTTSITVSLPFIIWQ